MGNVSARRAAGIVACLVLAATAVAGTAFAAAPSTGPYKGTSGFTFDFSISNGRCPTPADPSDPSARRGPTKPGLCFRTAAEGESSLACRSDGSISMELTDLRSFSGLRLSSGGTLLAKSYNEAGTPRDGVTTLSLEVNGNHASGYVEVTDRISGRNCDSGKMPFTAKRG